MVKHHLLYIFLLLTLAPVNLCGATADTSTRIVDPAFRALQIKVNDDDSQPAIIFLDSSDRLTISFDEIADDRRYMRYELIHCNAGWRPDGLVDTEFLDGFNEGLIEDYAFSQATLLHYVNYQLTIPNEQVSPKLSGNYLLRIYDENDRDTTLLQIRFSIVEPKMKVAADVSSRTDIDYNGSYQQLAIALDTEGTDINNPYTDIIVAIEQNGRQDNIATLTRPSRIAGTTLYWEHERDLIFEAGNEYRRMEIVSTNYPGMNVESYTYADPLYHATLLTDLPRADLPYSYDQTQFGRFRIREYNSAEPDTEADYIVTHFALEMPEQPFDIFIDGDLVQRQFSPESRMVFNRATGRYELALLLKQGAYNYQYLAVPAGSMRGSAAPVEGNRYQTANQYLIKVYHRTPGSRYDRLVGVTMAVSGR